MALWKSVAERFVVMLIGVGFSLLAIEAGLWTFDLPGGDPCMLLGFRGKQESDKLFRYDPVIGWKLNPNAHWGKYRINRQGWRGKEVEPQKGEEVFRVITVGDSSAFGLGVEFEESFSWQIVKALEEQNHDRKFDLLMAGVPGNTSFHAVYLLKHELLEYDPDLVITYLGGHNEYTRAKYYPDKDLPRMGERRRKWFHQIRVYRLWENVRAIYQRKVFGKIFGRKERVSLEDFRKDLREIVRVVRAQNIQLLILVPPYSEPLLERHPIATHYRQILLEEVEEEGLPFVDLQEPFSQKDPRKVYFPDFYHPNVLGHRIIAEEIVRALQTYRLLPGVEREEVNGLSLGGSWTETEGCVLLGEYRRSTAAKAYERHWKIYGER